jgi:hypothetical protein
MAKEQEEYRLSAAEYVDQLEAKYWSRQSVPPTQVVRALICRQALRSGTMNIDELGRLVKELGSSQPLLSNLMMTFLFRAKLRSIFKALNLDENTNHVITDIPIICIEHSYFKNPNATAARTPHDDQFILVDPRFATCMHSMVKLLLLRARSTQESGVGPYSESSPLSDSAVAESLKQLGVYAFSEQETLPRIPARETEKFQLWGAMLVHGIETFIICHELAHHLLGHKAFAVEAPGEPAEPNGSVLARKREEELEADKLGAALCYAVFEFYRDKDKAAASGVPPTWTREVYATPDIFCTFLDVWQRSWARPWTSDSHPPGAERREKIRQTFREKLPREVVEFAEGVQAIFESILAAG